MNRFYTLSSVSDFKTIFSTYTQKLSIKTAKIYVAIPINFHIIIRLSMSYIL